MATTLDTAHGALPSDLAPATRAAVEQFRPSLDRFPVAAMLSDARADDQPIVYCNDAFVKLTGYPREEILGRNCRFLQGGDTDPTSRKELREASTRARRWGRTSSTTARTARPSSTAS